MGAKMPQVNAQFGYGQQGWGQQPVPGVTLIEKGNGIDNNEYNKITYAVYDCIQQNAQMPGSSFSNKIAQRIKQTLKGDWYVMVCDINSAIPDFSFTKIKSGDYMTFTYGNGRFSVFKI